MTGIAMAMAASFGGVVANLAGVFEVVTAYVPPPEGSGPVSVNGYLRFEQAGTIQGIPSSGNISYTRTVPDRWYNPASGTPGASHWIRFDQVSGSTLNQGTLGTWQQLNANRDVGFASSTSAGRTAVARVRIASDSGGATVLSDSNITITRRQEPI